VPDVLSFLDPPDTVDEPAGWAAPGAGRDDISY